MELSGLDLQDKHSLLTPSPSAGRPQMLINTVGVYALPTDVSIHSTRQVRSSFFSPFP
jgi:hypothetical protein